jgi:hypothetical protein
MLLVDVRPTSSKALDIRATWNRPDRLQIWIQKTDLEASLTSNLAPAGAHEVTLRVPAGWATDPVNTSLLSVGLTSGGQLAADEALHLEMTPVPSVPSSAAGPQTDVACDTMHQTVAWDRGR